MAISFERMPVTIRVPGVYTEISNQQAVRGLVVKPYRILVIGQRLGAGTVAANVLTQVTRAEQAAGYFGRGSMLDRMLRALKLNNSFTECWALALDDSGAGTQGTGSIAFAGSPTAAGTLSLYIGGQIVEAAVTAGQTATAIAAAVAAAVNATTDLPVTAAAVAGTVNLTARHKGAAAGEIDVRAGYYAGEAVPAGLTAVATPVTGGTGNPSLAAAITAIGEEWFDIIAVPYTDNTNLALLKTELDDRWGPLRAIEGHAISAIPGTHASITAFGAAQNDPHLTVVGVEKSPTPAYEWASAVAGVAAYFGNIDPARPFQTLEIKGVLAPAEADRFTQAERNLCLYDGIATYTVDADGTCRAERLVTTYQVSSFGADDPSYLDLETMLTLGFLRYSFRARFRAKFPRHKLANDGTRFGPGQVVLTPKGAKAECFSLFRQWEELGLVEGFDQFKADIVVERNAGDPSRLDIYLPPDPVNQLRVTAAQIAFRL